MEAGGSSLAAGSQANNICVLVSFSKIFAIPGLRAGFLCGPKQLVKLVCRNTPPWSIGSITCDAITYICADLSKTKSFMERTRKFIATEISKTAACLDSIEGIRYFCGGVPFILCEIDRGIYTRTTAAAIKQKLLEQGILIRDCANFTGLDAGYFRFSIKKPDQNKLLVSSLKKLLEGAKTREEI